MKREEAASVVRQNLAVSAASFFRETARRALSLDDSARLAAGVYADRIATGDSPQDALAGLAPEELLFPLDRAVFARRLAARIADGYAGLLPMAGAGRRTAYVHNAFSDEAYLSFSRRISGMTVSYRGDLRSVAEDVSTGAADFCILPYADREGNRVHTASSLAERLELRLVMLAGVDGGEDGDGLTYALYAAGFLPVGTGTARVSFRMPELSCRMLSEFLAALDSLGAALLTCLATGEEKTGELTVMLPVGELPVALVYLCLFAPGAETTGFCPVE